MSLSVLLSTFANNILPVLLIGGAGFTLGKIFHIDSRSLGRVVFYVFSPVLIFNLLVQNHLNIRETIGVISLAVGVALSMGVITFILGSLLKFERHVLTAILITTMFANTGNYGLPLVSFAFGEQALSYAGVYFATTMFIFNTLGVLIASLGHMSLKESLLGLFRIPTVYAVVFAVLIAVFHVEIPAPVDRAVQLAADGTVPLMLVLLGVELTRVELTGSLPAVGLSVSLKLLLAPLVAIGLAMVLGVRGPALQAGVTEAATPTIVSSTVLATEYQLDSRLVTATIFISTLLSPLTLTPILVLLSR